MQKNLLLIIILILFSYISNASDSLPPLPLPEADSAELTATTDNISTWQKIKNFFGIGDKKPLEEHEIKKSTDQNHAMIESSVAGNTHSNDISHPSIIDHTESKDFREDNKKLADNENLQEGDKKLDISDDFFKDVEKHLQEEETSIVHKPESVGGVEHESVSISNKLDQMPSSIDSTANHSKNIANQEKDKNAQVASFPEVALPVNEEASLYADEKKDEINEKKNITVDLDVKSDNHKPAVDSQSFAVSKFKKEIESRNAKKVNDLPLIPEKDLNHNADSSLSGVLAADAKQLKFISDEAKVLIIPNDDVVLGELTENATLELMDFSSYVQIFWQDYERSIRANERQVISDFIDNYDENFNKVKWPLSSDDPYERLNDAFELISKQDTIKFIALLNNFSILWVKDKELNSMLHQAAHAGNYPAAKLLIMRGISLDDQNNQGETPLYIADKYNNPYVAYLLRKAGAISFSKLE